MYRQYQQLPYTLHTRCVYVRQFGPLTPKLGEKNVFDFNLTPQFHR